MIAFVEGQVASASDDALVVRTGPVALRVFVPAPLARNWREARIEGDPSGAIHLETSFQVREDSLTLYGFASEADREAFEVLLSVSGVGPKLALAALSAMSGAELRAAVASEDVAALQRIGGVGKKTAQRMILELASKLPPAVGATSGEGPRGPVVGFEAEVIQALEQLGWAKAQAVQAVEQARAGQPADAPALLKSALAWLSSSVGR